MIPLTSEQITARRVELHTVEDQLRTLGRRRSTLRAEILSGYAQPEKVDARQLSLPVEDKAALDEARSQDVRKAILLALEGRSQATAEGLLQIVGTQFRMTGRRPVTAEEIEDEVMALSIQGALVPGSKPGWYRRPQAPQSRAKNEKAPVEGPSEANLRRTVLRVMLPGAWMGVASILPAVNEATGATVETAEIVRCMQDLTNAGRVEDHPSAFSWRLVPEAPKATTAKKGKATPKKVTKPARKAAETKTATPEPPVDEAPPQFSPEARQAAIRAAILDELGHGLATFGELLTSTMRALAEARQGMPKHSEMHEALELLCRIGSVEKDRDGKSYRLPPPPAPEPKKKAPKKPKAPPPTVTVGEAVDKILAAHPPQRWQKTRALVAQRIAGNRGYPIPVAGLYLSGDGQGAEIDAVLALFAEAGAVQRKQSGMQRLVEAGAAVKEDDIPGDILRLTREYVLGLVVERNEPPTTDELAAALELPRGLVLSVLDELKDAGRLARAQAGCWIASAQDRTLPILPDVEPAPAREEAAELCPGTAPNTPPAGRPSWPVSPSAPEAAASARASVASTTPAAPP